MVELGFVALNKHGFGFVASLMVISFKATAFLAHQGEVTASEDRDRQLEKVAKLESEVTNLLARNTERGATIHEHEKTIHQLHTRIHELEAASKGAQQTISDLQHTVYNAREELRTANQERDRATERATELEAMVERYETQLDQVRKAIS